MARGVKGTAKPRKTFAEIDAARARYNPQVEGYGTPEGWRESFYARMGFEEAQRVVGNGKRSPRQILNVGADALWNEIKSAYRKMAMQYHPDRVTQTGLTLAVAEEKFKEVTAAYVMLEKEFETSIQQGAK